MTNKKTEQISLRCTSEQYEALMIDAGLRGISHDDVLRDFMDSLYQRHLRTFKLMKNTYELNENSEYKERK